MLIEISYTRSLERLCKTKKNLYKHNCGGDHSFPLFILPHPFRDGTP